MKLQETIKQLPNSAGVYQYFDKNGRILYVGKAKNLSNRVKSYWRFTPEFKANDKLSLRIQKMLNQTTSLNYIVVNSEHDALILENSLIKELNPKYNILLRDDKTYPYLYIDKSKEYPRFEITRKVIKSKDISYFGPYSIGAKDILDSIYELTQLVQKKGSLKSKKICLYHQIGRCLAPCELVVSKQRYDDEVKLATSFIENKSLLIKKLIKKMEFYAQELRFEEAKELRDRIARIKKSQIKSEIDFANGENYDIFTIKSLKNRVVILRIFMRNGKVISSSHDYLDIGDDFYEDELYSRVFLEFYKTKPPIIPKIIVDKKFEDIEIIENFLSDIFSKKTSIFVPKRGEKKRLIELANINAQELLKKETKIQDNYILEEIKDLYSLEKLPKRIEIFDNSHMAGEATVGAMVVYDTFKFDKKSYRLYHLVAKDEYAQMKEILTKRIYSFEKNPMPDLWVLDGGSTLLKLAFELLKSNGIYLDVIAISKEKVDAKAYRAKGKANDIVYTKDNIFRLKNSDKRLQFIQNLRDEAHKSAITFHKKTKLKLNQETKLLSLHGISQVKIKKLLNHFGTFQEIKKVSLDDISMVLNEKDAKTIKNFYK